MIAVAEMIVIFSVWARINGMALTKVQYEVQEKENVHTGQENTICIFC